MAKTGSIPAKETTPAAASVAASATDVAKWEERAHIADLRARESEAVLRRVEADIKRIQAEVRLRDLMKAKPPG